MFGIFKPKAHIDRLSPGSIDSTYSRLRWQLFIGIFVATPVTIWFVKTSVWRCLILSSKALAAVT